MASFFLDVGRLKRARVQAAEQTRGDSWATTGILTRSLYVSDVLGLSVQETRCLQEMFFFLVGATMECVCLLQSSVTLNEGGL